MYDTAPPTHPWASAPLQFEHLFPFGRTASFVMILQAYKIVHLFLFINLNYQELTRQCWCFIKYLGKFRECLHLKSLHIYIQLFSFIQLNINELFELSWNGRSNYGAAMIFQNYLLIFHIQSLLGYFGFNLKSGRKSLIVNFVFAKSIKSGIPNPLTCGMFTTVTLLLFKY